MQSIWLSLVWKEWREYRWKLAALSVIILVSPFLFTAWIEANSFMVYMRLFLGTLLCYCFLAGMFLGFGVAAKENSVGTAPFLQSLPIPAWKAAAAKLAVDSVVAITPIILLFVASYGYFLSESYSVEDLKGLHGLRSIEPVQWVGSVHWTGADWFLCCLLAAIVGTLSLLWWAAALGVNRSDEIRAGAIGFLGIVGICGCMSYLYHLADKYELGTLQESLEVAIAAIPGGFATKFHPTCPWYIAQETAFGRIVWSMLGLISHFGVVGWFLYRFGRVSPKTGRGDGVLSKRAMSASLKGPFKSQLTAIAWKQMRETGPLAVLALAGIFAVAGFISLITTYEQTTYDQETFSRLFIGVGGSMSFFVVMVAGIGLYLEELKPGLNQFWRSRPNDLRLWFWVKFLSGMLVLVTVLGILLFLTGWSQWSETHNPEWKELWGGTLYVTWMFVITYSLAMTYQCLIRQPIYEALLTMATLWAGLLVLSIPSLGKPHLAMVAIGMIASLAVVVTLAWKTVKHDWGWKS
jgi:protein-S-isoprenylcysteine O-methyltransferase Ste14